MRPEKTTIVADVQAKLQKSPFLLIADYSGMQVKHFEELRNRLGGVGAECRVVKNSFVKRAVKELGMPDLNGALTGQTAVVTGEATSAPPRRSSRLSSPSSRSPSSRQASSTTRSSTPTRSRPLPIFLPRKFSRPPSSACSSHLQPSSSARSTNPAQASLACSRPRRTPPRPRKDFPRCKKPHCGITQRKNRFLVGSAAAGLKCPEASGRDDTK